METKSLRAGVYLEVYTQEGRFRYSWHIIVINNLLFRKIRYSLDGQRNKNPP